MHIIRKRHNSQIETGQAPTRYTIGVGGEYNKLHYNN